MELSNIDFIHADFITAGQRISGQFDYIIAHGVFSWVSDDVRDALLELSACHLRPGGLLYLNYNTRPGWNIRGMVREFLLAQTAGTANLRIRAQMAQDVSARVVSGSTEGAHPFSQLMANEFRFVCENDVSYVAHEFLATDNHPYWRSEFLTLVRRHGFEYVADADFSDSSGRIPEDLEPRLGKEQITGRSIEDTVDLLCYRQLHSPILTMGPLVRRQPGIEELGYLLVASCLAPCAQNGSKNPMFQHPSGYQVEAKDEVMRSALELLQPLWPRGLCVRAVFPDVGKVIDDLKLLQRNGLIELRCVEPCDFGVSPSPLNRLEASWADYVTTPYHAREAVPKAVDAQPVSTIVRSSGQRLHQTGPERNSLQSPFSAKGEHVVHREPYPV